MAKKYAIDLNSMLAALDARDMHFYHNLDDQQKKEFSAWLSMRWASSVEGDAFADTLLKVNRRVNVRFSDLIKHPELQWQLMASCGTGLKRKHTFIPPSKKAKKNKLMTVMAELFPLLSSSDLELLLSINTKEDIKVLLQDHGFDNKAIKEILPK
jgi:hypothetical protein